MISAVQTSVVHSAPSAQSSQGSCGASPDARLLALMVQNQLVQGESAKTSVNLSKEELKQLRETIRQALEDAREANEDSGFWGDIGDVLGGDIASLAEVVAVAAAAVATGGAAAVVLAAITIGCSLASKYSDELGIPPKVAIGIGIAAAVTSVATGNMAAGGGVASLTSASNGATAVGTEAAQVSRLTQIAQQVKFAANLIAPVATGAGAGANLVSGYYQSEAVDHNADAHAAQSREKLESMEIDAAVDLLGKALDRQLAAMGEMTQTLEANQQSKQLIVHAFQGVA
jgi:hypothetical protein